MDVFDPATLQSNSERIITRYSYDAVGNETTRTRAADSVQAARDYSYYDGAGRRVAVIDSDHVLYTFSYDAMGNMTQQARSFNRVDASVDLNALDGSTDFSALVTANANDQVLAKAYDAANRLLSETDLRGAGSGLPLHTWAQKTD